MMDKHTASYYDYLHLVPFTLHGQEFAFELHDVIEIANISEIKKVPHFSEGVKGVMSLHGEQITVFDIREKLGLPEKALDWKAKVLVCPHEDKRVGVIVENVLPITEVKRAAVQEAPHHIFHKIREGVSGVALVGGKMITILDAQLLLGKEEVLEEEHPVKDEKMRAEQEERLHKKLMEEIEGTVHTPGVKRKPRILADVPSDKVFSLADGRTFRSLYELIDVLRDMDDATFYHHVNAEKNDFASWIGDAVGDSALAERVAALKTKDAIALEAIKRVLHLEIVDEE